MKLLLLCVRSRRLLVAWIALPLAAAASGYAQNVDYEAQVRQRAADEAATVVQMETLVASGQVRRTGTYSAYHNWKSATTSGAHVCNAACYEYENIAGGSAAAGHQASPDSRPIPTPFGGTVGEQKVALAAGVLGWLLTPKSAPEPQIDYEAEARADQQRAQERARIDAMQRKLAADLEEQRRREAEAERMRAEAERLRTSARNIAASLGDAAAYAREGGADGFSALLLSPAPAVKKLAYTIVDVAGDLGGPAAKSVAAGYKFASTGVDLINEAQHGSAVGVALKSGSLVSQLAPLAEKFGSEDHEHNFKALGSTAKLGEAGAAALEGDYWKAGSKATDVAAEFLPDRLKPLKTIKSGVTGVVETGVEIEKAAQANDELMQLFQQNQAQAQGDNARFGAKAQEFLGKADALEAQARQLELGRVTGSAPAPTGKGEPMVLPDIPITVPRTAPAAKSAPAAAVPLRPTP